MFVRGEGAEKQEGVAQWLRIEVHKDIFVFDHILHFPEYTRVQLG